MSKLRSLALFSVLAVPALMRGDILYSSIPASLPPNVPGQAYAAGDISEFGEYVQLTSPAMLNQVTVTLSNWAPHSAYASFGDSTGYTESLTLNLYAVDSSSGTVEPGALLATMTDSAVIPWRAESDGTCGAGANPFGLWRAGDNNCYNGLAFSVNFMLPDTLVGSQLIWGLAFNTSTAGNPAFGSVGPYDSLNIGLLLGSPSTGSDPLPDTAYLNSTAAAFYADGGAGGTGTFRQDQGWTGAVAMAQFQGTGVPEPSTIVTIAAGLVAVGLLKRSVWRSR